MATTDLDSDFRDGEKFYGDLVQKAQSYGDCWKSTISDLHSGCKTLTEEIQSRLALAFANCFLMHVGLVPCHCVHDAPISECLKNCEYRVLSTYTEFFTYTYSICHYLNHRQWQEEASRTALELSRNSRLVSRKLDESFRFQSKIVQLQQSALKEQIRLISTGKTLKAELQQSRENARDMYLEFRTTASEQKFLLFQVFDRVKNLQNFVLGEFSGVYTIVYYVIIASLTYILTSVPQTADARIWLILVVSLNAVSERIVTARTLQENYLETNHHGINGLLSSRIWLCRKIVCVICFIILLMTYYHYKDYNAINNELLKEILQQNKELQNFIRGLRFHEDTYNAFLNSQTKHSSVVLEFINAANKKITAKATAGNLKKISQKEVVCQKKATVSRSRGNTPIISSPGGNILTEVESPSSPYPRYNLRRSKELLSPQQNTACHQ